MACGCHGRRERIITGGRASSLLAAQTQVGDQLEVAIVLSAGQVVEQTASLADHLEQAAARVIVVLVAAQVFCQRIDTVGQQRDLDVCRASIGGVEPVLLNNRGSVGLSEGHGLSFSSSTGARIPNPQRRPACQRRVAPALLSLQNL